MLTEKEQRKFISRHKNRYGDTSKEFAEILKKDENSEKELWKSNIKSIIGDRKYNKLYKHRPRGKETIGEKVFNNLWLDHGPVVLS